MATFADMTVISGSVSETDGVLSLGNGGGAYSTGTFDDCYLEFTLTESVAGITIHINDPDQSPFGSEVVFWLHGGTADISDGWRTVVGTNSITQVVGDVIKFEVTGDTATIYQNEGVVCSGTVTNNSAGYVGIRNSESSTVTVGNLNFGANVVQNDFIIDDSGSTSSAENVDLIGNFQIQDSSSSSSAENVTLTGESIPSFSLNRNIFLETGQLALQIEGLKIPVWNEAGKPVAPKNGLIGFNTTSDALEIWDGIAWNTISPSDLTNYASKSEAIAFAIAL